MWIGYAVFIKLKDYLCNSWGCNLNQKLSWGDVFCGSWLGFMMMTVTGIHEPVTMVTSQAPHIMHPSPHKYHSSSSPYTTTTIAATPQLDLDLIEMMFQMVYGVCCLILVAKYVSRWRCWWMEHFTSILHQFKIFDFFDFIYSLDKYMIRNKIHFNNNLDELSFFLKLMLLV